MISLLSLPLALLPTTILGWLVLRLLEWKKPVLFTAERWVMGCVLGSTLAMYLVFVANAFLAIPLTFWGFLETFSIPLIILGSLWLAISKRFPASPPPHTTLPLPPGTRIILGFLLLTVAIRIVITGMTFLLFIPSFFQDTLNNWNLRGKVFYETHTLTLIMPNEDPVLSPQAVSSYPPTVPLVKTWLALSAGEWSEPLINSIHIVWYLGALALLFFAIRRMASAGWALLGVYVLGSMPLYLMHGTNAYADAFVSVHVFIAVSLTFFGLRAEDASARASFLRLAALGAGVLSFTKNEGLLIFLPPLLLITILSLGRDALSHRMSWKESLRIGCWYILTLALIAVPWLSFKWMHGLTFGNGKPFTSLGIGWQKLVPTSIFVNTFFEGNWLLLFPLLFGLLVWRWRAAFGRLAPIVSFFLLIYVGQMLLYLFTKLSQEALMQTGYARGLVQLLPTICFIIILLLKDSAPVLGRGLRALAERTPFLRS